MWVCADQLCRYSDSQDLHTILFAVFAEGVQYIIGYDGIIFRLWEIELLLDVVHGIHDVSNG